MHRKFIQECRKIGIKPNEYPFNTTIAKWISSQYIREVARNSGGQSTMLLNNTNNTISSNSTIIRPLERVEFDGHKIDAIFAIVYQTPEGEKIVDILDRVWLLTVIDVTSRAIIGYHFSLNKEYSKEDVKKCFQAAIIPWEPKELSIQGLKYAKKAGFPSNKFSEAEYAVWDEVCYDNTKSHLSNEVKDLLVKQIGCSINMGPVAVPVRRPIVERLYKTLEENGFHRLPSTTGSNVMDHRRNDAEKNAIKFSITVDSLVELCDVVISNYNAAPHDSNYGFSPLEIFESRLEQGVTISQIPREDRSKINLFPISKICSVKGNLQKGRRPYIHYKNVRYTSPELIRDFAWTNAIPNGGVYVAESHEGIIVGFSKGGKERSSKYNGYDGELYAIYILKEYQGKGIGKALVKPVIDEIKGMGLNSMLVLVLKNNISRLFYESLGGRKIDTVEVEIGGKKFFELVYGWEDIRNIF